MLTFALPNTTIAEFANNLVDTGYRSLRHVLSGKLRSNFRCLCKEGFVSTSHDPKFSDIQAWANSADPDQTAV